MEELKISLLGGKNEIGGNKVLFEHKDTKLMLDFGLSFDKYKEYFAEFLQPRKCNAFLDFIEFDLLPNIQGIYRKDYCLHCGINFPEKRFLNALLLSHAHIDHSGLIHFLREDMPIFCTEETFLILQALEETSTRGFMDLVNLSLDFHFTPTKKGGYKRLEGEKSKIERNFFIMKPYEKYKVGDIEVQAIPVDHSLPGACAFIIYTDKGNIVYTGDFRFHGRRKELSKKFVEISKNALPEIMICEGTRIDEKDNVTEEDVEKASKEIVEKTDGLVVVNYPIRDLDRLLTFFNVARATGRKLVVNLRQAYLLKLFEKLGNYPKLDEVCIYVERKGWGLISDEFYFLVPEKGWVKGSEIDKKHVKSDYFKWERKFLDLDNVVTYKDLREHPEDFIFRCDYFELQELIDIKPKNGCYIRSLTEPFSEDMLIEENRVKNWLEHFNLLPIHQIHASGHLNGLEIKEMLKEINPKNIIPIHTKHPELFFE
jgi:ribonuclease J